MVRANLQSDTLLMCCVINFHRLCQTDKSSSYAVQILPKNFKKTFRLGRGSGPPAPLATPLVLTGKFILVSSATIQLKVTAIGVADFDDLRGLFAVSCQ